MDSSPRASEVTQCPMSEGCLKGWFAGSDITYSTIEDILCRTNEWKVSHSKLVK